jgi:uncharacterized protein (TIGR00725 family)
MQPIIGVMGPGESASDTDQSVAYELGRRIAESGWVLLTGGRCVGVMDAASRGAKSAKGLTVGILPGSDRHAASEAVDITILTGMGNARNAINILSSDVVIACGMGAGTVSEIALAIKADKPVILLNASSESQHFFQALAGNQVQIAARVEEAIALVNQLIQRHH